MDHTAKDYDYIIVGAGSATAMLRRRFHGQAARLDPLDKPPPHLPATSKSGIWVTK